MSAKLLHALTDDNPDLQKQIGCMTGIFQLFDRQPVLAGRRMTSHTHSQRRAPPGHSHFSDHNLRDETNNGRYSSKNVNEKQRVSVESSRASISSSSSSSTFSSIDCNKTAQPEHPPSERNIFPGTSSRDFPVTKQRNSAEVGRQSLDFRNVVKDSIYKEARVLSVKTTTKEEPLTQTTKRRDSPRPLQLSETADASYGLQSNGKSRVPADFTESLRALGKLREEPGYFNEAKERPRSSYEMRNGPSLSVPKDSRRLSYDGPEIPRSSFESRDNFKSMTQVKELPRLSLDSRDSSMRSSDSVPQSSSDLKDLKRDSDDVKRAPCTPQESASHKQQTSSIVAKLMGLETMPSSNIHTDGHKGLIKSCTGQDHDCFSVSFERTAAKCNENRTVRCPRSPLKEPTSPRLRNPDFVMRPISNSKSPIEPAPWRHLDGARSRNKSATRIQEIPRTPTNPSPSIYSDIEKRLKELEFKQTDNDLRVLKHMLDAMQGKRHVETKEEDQASNSEYQGNYNNLYQTNHDQLPKSGSRRNPQNNRPASATVKGTRPYESQIVIMKPVKPIENTSSSVSSVTPANGLSGLHKLRTGDSVNSRKAPVNSRMAKDLTTKTSYREPAHGTIKSTDKRVNRTTSVSAQTSSSSQHIPKESTISSGKSSGSISPRLQQKKLELEKQARPPIPQSDASKQRKQSVKQTAESGTPGGKRRSKPPKQQQNYDQLKENSKETRNLSQQGDDISVRSDSNISLGSQLDVEVTSADRSAEVNSTFLQQGCQSPSMKVADSSVSVMQQQEPSHWLAEEGPLAQKAVDAPEQPSPISVLDPSFYRDDLPSPEKNMSDAFTDYQSRNSDDCPGEEEWRPMDHSSQVTGTYRSSAINRKKLENVEHLVQKLRRLNSNHDESTTDYIASLCENDKPDDRYISEILLASGLLLRDLGSGLTSIQHHPSGHPINPDLFFVLEQTKASSRLSKNNHNCEKVSLSKSDQEKVHRKLVFDAINEVLDSKLAIACPSTEPWFRGDKLARRTLNAQQLLKELCSEIEKLQANQRLECNDCVDDNDGLKPILFKDVMSLSQKWTDSHAEVSGVVLDIERLIYKDLVAEIVNAEAVTLQAKQNRRRKQLFAK